MGSMVQVFEAAGLQFHGERYFGEAWTESFITESLPDVSQAAKEELLAVHKSPIVPMAQKAYLIAALASVVHEDHSPKGWNVPGWPDTTIESQLAAALCDALALKHPRIEQETKPAPAAAPEELERLELEKRTLVRTLDTVATQIADIQGEKRALAEQIRTLETENTRYREDQLTHRSRAEALTQLLHEREERHQKQHDLFLDLSMGVRDLEATIKTQQDELAELRKRSGDEGAKLKQDNNDLQSKLKASLSATQAERAAAGKYRADLDVQRAAASRLQKQLEATHTNWVAAVSQFDTASGKLLETVRSQRAWHVMLLVRQAYARLVR